MAFELNTITPEKAGIPSAVISEFLDKLEERKIVLHSLLMVKDGNLLTEAYWKPFDVNFKHRLYSSSKSFVSAAIGILAGENKISLDDKVIKYFPEKISEKLNPIIAETTIRDLLRMTTPSNIGTVYRFGQDDWCDPFFNMTDVHYPGTIFKYDTTAPTLMCMLIKRVTNMELTEFLNEKLFKHIGIADDIECIKTPCGYDWGGSGMICTSRDFARFALICSNMGQHDGKQLIPEWYMKEAISKQVDNRSTMEHVEKSQGYGYQSWCLRNNGFATTGMGSQLSINLPQYKFSMITTGDTQSIPNGYEAYIIPAFWDIIYPYIEKNKSIDENEYEYNKLQQKIDKLSVPVVDGMMYSPIVSSVHNKEYKLQDNPMHICRIRFAFNNNEGEMFYVNDTGEHSIRFGFGHQVIGEFPEKYYYGDQIGKPLGKGYKCITSAAWGMEDSLFIYLYAIDKYFGKLKINVVFRENKISLFMQKNAEKFFEDYEGFAYGETLNS